MAVAWVLVKGILPIIGPRTQAQLADNLASTDVTLSAEQIDRMDRASAIAMGFPHDVIAGSAASLAENKAELVDSPHCAVC